MKNNFKIIATLALSSILISCSSVNKSETSKIKFKGDELIVFKNNILTDPVSKYWWRYFDDNPTTYFRLKLNNMNSPGKLPSIEQLNALFQKVTYQLNNKKHPGNIDESGWFNTDCDFLTSSSIKTNEGEIHYEVLHWNSKTRSSSRGSVTGGDLVVVLLLNEN
jgi:hypothetical protein